jgi:hypothetical protein
MRGATSKQAKSRSVQKQAHPVKRIHFTDVKPLRQFLMILSTILVQKDFKNGLKGEVPASSIKGNQNIFNSFDSQDLPKGYQAAKGFLSNFQAKYLCSMGTLPSRDPARTANTRI